MNGGVLKHQFFWEGYKIFLHVDYLLLSPASSGALQISVPIPVCCKCPWPHSSVKYAQLHGIVEPWALTYLGFHSYKPDFE